MYAKYAKYAQIRDAKNLTDYEVSKSTGVSTVTISMWKKGAYIPKYDKLCKIAKFLECAVDDFMDEGEL